MAIRCNDEEFEKICKEEAASGETVVVGRPVRPRTDLGKLLLALVQSVGGLEPQTFVNVNVSKAIKQADSIRPE
jgi:hypothetical protein